MVPGSSFDAWQREDAIPSVHNLQPLRVLGDLCVLDFLGVYATILCQFTYFNLLAEAEILAGKGWLRVFGSWISRGPQAPEPFHGQIAPLNNSLLAPSTNYLSVVHNGSSLLHHGH